MSMEQIIEAIRSFDGMYELAPRQGSPFPEVAWGGHFFYYAPDGEVPRREQPYATIITKNYPGDMMCDLDPPDRWRLNIHVGRAAFADLIGHDPRSDWTPDDLTATDVVIPHPLYRAQGWVSIIKPDNNTHALACRLLRDAHDAAIRRATSPRSHQSHPSSRQP